MGAAMVEYGLLITGIALVVAVFVVAFGVDIAELFTIDLGG